MLGWQAAMNMASDEKTITVETSQLEASDAHSTDRDAPRASDHEPHEFSEKEDCIITGTDLEGAEDIRYADDGHTRLVPQPSDDPNDPLNWSWRKKHTILIIMAAAAFLPDYGSATGAVTLELQAEEWDTTADVVNHTQAGNVFMVGAGGVFAVMFSAYFGRLPVMFWFLVIALATAAWCAAATGYDSFMAARILNGFFSTVTQGGGMMFIQDMFFFHERPRKINIWASFFIISPYLGPLLAAFMIVTEPWSTPFWVYTAETAIVLILTALLVDETYYDRRIAPAEQPPRGSHLARLTGVAQFRTRHQRNSFTQACMRAVVVLLKPVVALSSLYYLLTFAWVVGINTTLSIFLTPLYAFGPRQIGFFYFTPVVAVLLGEVTGHWLHDVMARRYAAAHGGRVEPEARLRAVAVALPCMVVGLVLVGQALEHAWHYMALAVAWGLYVYGIMITTVAVSAYVLDAYPEASGEVSAHMNNARTLGGFIISYFQVRWANSAGPSNSFGVQAGVTAAAFGIVVVMMVYGKKLRTWSGPLNFATA